ncbi:hypothetical protein SNE40_013309 [Patella caerulea]|uniref:Sushi domain-containing protein n=1 Tax=Patella caerulea TaxID=87958 RepID=A0AAN8JKS7_PATCE
MASPQCPMLTSSNVQPTILTADTIKELRLSTYKRLPGTVVNLSCYGNYTLIGTDQVVCSQDGEWNYYTKPYCNLIQTGQLSDLHKLLLGVGVGTAILSVIVLIAIIGALLYRSKKRKQRARSFRHPSTVTLAYSDFDGYRPFGIISPFSYEDREFFPDGKPMEKIKTTHAPLAIRNGTSQRTTQGPRPLSPKVTISETLPEFRSRSRSVDGIIMAVPITADARELERLYSTTLPNKAKKQNSSYSGEWKDRDDYKRMDYFNGHALAQGHDPFLWRPGSTRWICEQ